MTIAQLLAELSEYPAEMPIMILDGFNGGGAPREINCGPHTHTITAADADQTADCEEREGETVVVLGYGCY